MPRDFFPRREGEIVSWSSNLNQKIGLSAQDYGLTPEMAASYAVKHERFVEMYLLAQDGKTRTPYVLELKRVARRDLEAEARVLAGIVRAMPFVSNDQRISLGLSLRRAGKTRIAPPTETPNIVVAETRGRTVKLRLSILEALEKRGKGRGASGTKIFSYVGEHPPASRAQWNYVGDTTVMKAQVTFDQDVPPGAKVWFAARFYNPRGQEGPTSAPVSTHIPGGSVMPVASAGLMKAA